MSKGWSINQAQRLVAMYTRKRNIPRKCNLAITHYCNFRCVHCYLQNDTPHRKEISFKQICLVIDQLADLGVFFLLVNGGEPLLRPDFWDIMHYARKRGFAVSLNTNASLIDNDTAKRLADLVLATVTVSVYGMTQRSFQKVTRIKGDFGKVLRGVEFLVKVGIPVHAKMMLFNMNFSDMEKFMDWATKLRITHNSPWDYYPCLDKGFMLKPFKHSITDTQAQKLLSCSGRLDFDYMKGKPADTSVLCGLGGREMFTIDSYGRVSPCFYIVNHTNIKDRPIGEIIKDDPCFTSFRGARFGDAKKCLNCDLVSFCLPCAAAFHLFTNKMVTSRPPRLMCKARRGKLKKMLYYRKKLLKKIENGARASDVSKDTESVCA